jgi:predicted negative regulator of RcsB-dependent stress response
VVVLLLVIAAIGTVLYQRHQAEARSVVFFKAEQRLGTPPLSDADRAAARTAFHDFIAAYPKDELAAVAWLHLARMGWESGDLDAAEAAFGEALRVKAAGTALQAIARVGMAKVQEQRGQLEASALLYEELPAGSFGDLRQLSMGRLAAAQNDIEAARRHFQAVLDQRPPSVLGNWAGEALAYLP